ncbi:MAG: nitroreductase family protein [Bacteroidales bacterium]|jgi:nitroreductase|nr:nitroreductase family protein [Bacteroidales bacterium]
MNDLIQTMLSHRSIRVYQEKKIPPEMLEQISRAACSGSTMGNMQLFSIIMTEDKQKMREMAPYHFNQSMATNAPLILTFCADFNRFNRYCACRGCETDAYDNLQSYHWAITDALIAAQNACVAAEALGLGICWLGTITYQSEAFIRVLHLPERVLPVACISMGYPAEQPEMTDKLPIEALIHREIYEDYTPTRINKLYAEKEKHPNTLNLLKENNAENLAQIFVNHRYVKKDNEHFAEQLLASLKKQKFMK